MRSNNFLYIFFFFFIILEFFFLVGYSSGIYHLYIYFFIVFIVFKSFKSFSILSSYVNWTKSMVVSGYTLINLLHITNNILKKSLLFLYFFYIIFIAQSKLIYKYQLRNIHYIRNIVRSKFLANNANK